MDSDSTSGPSAGDSVAYTFRVENNGTATAWGLAVSADLGGGVACIPVLESLQLAPGDWTDCTSTYEVGGSYAPYVRQRVTMLAIVCSSGSICLLISQSICVSHL